MIKKLAKYLNIYLTKDKDDKCVWRNSTSYLVREMQIKTRRYIYTSVWIVKIPKHCQHQIPVRMWSNRNSHTLLMRIQNMYSHFWKSVCQFLSKLKYSYHIILQLHSLDFTRRSWKLISIQKPEYVFIATLFTVVKTWNQLRCL